MARMVFLLSVIAISYCHCVPHARAAALLRNPASSGKRQIQRRASSDQHIVMSARSRFAAKSLNNFPQPAADPITLDGISDLLRDGEAEPCRARVTALARLAGTSRGRRTSIPVAAAASPPVASIVPWKQCAAIFTAVRRTAVCVSRPRRADTTLRPPLLPCARGSRDGACVRACSVEQRPLHVPFSAGRALKEEDAVLEFSSKPDVSRAGTRFCAAYKGGALARQCDRLPIGPTLALIRGTSAANVKMPHKLVSLGRPGQGVRRIKRQCPEVRRLLIGRVALPAGRCHWRELSISCRSGLFRLR